MVQGNVSYDQEADVPFLIMEQTFVMNSHSCGTSGINLGQH